MNATPKTLAGKVAVVTGSGRGIGRGIASRLAGDGAHLVLNARTSGAIESFAKELRRSGAKALPVAADVGQADEVDGLFGKTLDEYGGVDILVNNAGWANPICHFLELDEEHWDSVLQTNLKSVYLCSHRAANLMVDQGRTGAIVNIGSFGAARAHRSQSAYDATKGAIESFSRAMALDLAPFGIRVNVVGPGAIHTEEHEPQGQAAKRRRGETVPLGRVGLPADIAPAVAFLVSDDAAYITGQVVYVDGGVLAQLRSPQVDRPLPGSVKTRLREDHGG